MDMPYQAQHDLSHQAVQTLFEGQGQIEIPQ